MEIVRGAWRRRRWWGVLLSSFLATGVYAEFPYPPNPRPCRDSAEGNGCIQAQDYASYLFLPESDPPTIPNDFTGGTAWKLGSSKTGNADIDTSPQELFGVTGASVDLAWQITTGRPDVVIAVLDSGIRWHRRLPDLVAKFYLNRGELPVPEGSQNTYDRWDRNGDGVFNVHDYEASEGFAADSRVRDANGNGMLDPEDLIFLFSDGVDDDGNGFPDDISGWDFFEDDNDPLDEVDYGHGTGEAHDSGAEANNGGSVGTCPNCMLLMVRVGDSFIAEVNAFARGVLFAVDSGAMVIQEALGTLNQSSFAQAAIDYAYRRGVVVIASAADEESSHHNYPAAYARTVVVNSVTRYAAIGGVTMSPPSYLYLNGCTNYGPHIAVAVPSTSCSSEATGLSAGMAGLVYSAARNAIDRGRLTTYPQDDGSFAPFPLSANEVKQILTMSADDIDFDARPELGLPQNYRIDFALPQDIRSERFPSIAGFDQYFGYGRINARRAVERVRDGQIPPEASIESPAWFTLVSPSQRVLSVIGRVAANRAASFSWVLEVAPGVQPREDQFAPVASGEEERARTGTLGEISLAELAERMPYGVTGPATDASGRPDPERFTVTLRLRVRDDRGRVGEDRRAVFLHHDPDAVLPTPYRLGSDGASPPVFADITGDGIDELIVATSDGLVHAFMGRDLQESPGWPVHTAPMEVQVDSPAFRSGEVEVPFTPVLAVPAVGDLDRDGTQEVVVADLYGRVYVWDSLGRPRLGFPVRTRPEYSFPFRSEREATGSWPHAPDMVHRLDADNRLARGFIGGPVLANLDHSSDGSLEIIAAAMDRHVYAWFANGQPVPGWPVLLKDPTKVSHVDPVTNTVTLLPNAGQRMGSKIIIPPSVGDVDGDGRLDVIAGVNEAYKERPNAVITNVVINFLQVGGALDSGNARIYAIHAEGTNRGSNPVPFGWNPEAFLPGWPQRIALLTTELLPVVGTGVNGPAALADLDGDGRHEIATFSMLGPAYVFRGDGTSFLGTERGTIPRTLQADVFGASSISIDAPSYPALGAPVLAEMFGPGTGFQLVGPTAGLGKLLDANLPARQTPAENHLAAWNLTSAAWPQGNFLPGFPHIVNDLQFLVGPIVADITGDGVAEAISGSGVYDLHAVDGTGVVAAGWPKFTGGWSVGSPAVGDLDGDGVLEVAAVTREGNLFVFATRGAACGNIPWRQFHHDQWGTGNYHSDARPPAAPFGRIEPSGSRGLTVAIPRFPGDDGFCGAPATLELRASVQPIVDKDSFEQALTVELQPAGVLAVGMPATLTLRSGLPSSVFGRVYFAARAADDAGNSSPVVAYGALELGPVPSSTPSATRTASPTMTPSRDPTVTPSATATAIVTVPLAATPTATSVPPTRTPPTIVQPTRPAIADSDGCSVQGSSGWSAWPLVTCCALGMLARRKRRMKTASVPEARSASAR